MDHSYPRQGSSVLPLARKSEKVLVCLLFLLTACGSEESDRKTPDGRQRGSEPTPTRFQIEEKGYGYELRILPEAGTASEKVYQLIERDKKAPDKQGGAIRLRIPVERMACASSTHAGMLLALGESQRIAAFPSKKHLYDKELRRRMEENDIEAVGMQRSLNMEKLVSLEVGILLGDGMSKGGKNKGKRLREAGIPTLEILAWKETGPIARLDWLQVFGALTGRKSKADSIIEARSRAYDSIASLIPSGKKAPEVLCNAPHKGTWHVPGGNSFMSHMIRDAGGKQPWPENDATGGVPKSLEEVIAKGADADIWLNPGRRNSLKEVSAVDTRIARIKAFNKGAVYRNDRRKVKGGGNDHWESGIVHPELILADLLQIFHPDLMPEPELHYYRKLPKKARQ